MDYLQVEGHSNLIRDPKTNSIINRSSSDYNQYLINKSLKEKENQKLQYLEQDIANMKENIEEIKTLLRRLANGS